MDAARPQRLNQAPQFTARDYARHLLASLDVETHAPLQIADEHPAVTWKRSGLMALTGPREGPARMCPVPLAALADGALVALASLGPANALEGMRGSGLLAERAAISGASRQGSIAPGGACRLLHTRDGRIAVNLARDDDWAALPAWLEIEPTRDWDVLASVLRLRSGADLQERARLLGLAVALENRPELTPPPWFRMAAEGPRARMPAPRPRVLDLSALWAGPLCGLLLQRLGADVIKVESAARPDGARRGPAQFFERLNGGKQQLTLDFARDAAHLAALIDGADIVIESTRPRALRQLGIDAETRVRQRPGLTWIAISGHGRQPPRDQWVAFGDDAAVAAGLSSLLAQCHGEPLIGGDAIADPLTGMHAALAGWACHRMGGGRLLDLSLHDVTAHAIGFDCPRDAAALAQRTRAWTKVAQDAELDEAIPIP